MERCFWFVLSRNIQKIQSALWHWLRQISLCQLIWKSSEWFVLQGKTEHLPSFPLTAHWIHKTSLGAILHGCDFSNRSPAQSWLAQVGKCVGVVWGVIASTTAFCQTAPRNICQLGSLSIRKMFCLAITYLTTLRQGDPPGQVMSKQPAKISSAGHYRSFVMFGKGFVLPKAWDEITSLQRYLPPRQAGFEWTWVYILAQAWIHKVTLHPQWKTSLSQLCLSHRDSGSSTRGENMNKDVCQKL